MQYLAARADVAQRGKHPVLENSAEMENTAEHRRRVQMVLLRESG